MDVSAEQEYVPEDTDQTSFEEALFDHHVESSPDDGSAGTSLIQSIGRLREERETPDYNKTNICDINIGNNKPAKIVAFHGPTMQNPNGKSPRGIDEHYSSESFESVEAYVKGGLKNPQDTQSYQEMRTAYSAFFETVVADLNTGSDKLGVVVIVPKICGSVYAAQYRGPKDPTQSESNGKLKAASQQLSKLAFEEVAKDYSDYFDHIYHG